MYPQIQIDNDFDNDNDFIVLPNNGEISVDGRQKWPKLLKLDMRMQWHVEQWEGQERGIKGQGFPFPITLLIFCSL